MDLKSIQNISLDTTRNKYITVTAKAGDIESRFVHIQITNEGKAVAVDNDKVIKAKIRTPDNRLIELLSYETESTPKHIDILNDGTLMVQLSAGTLLVAGNAKCEIEIISGNTILSTFMFNINIAEQVYSDDDILDDSEVKSMVAVFIEEMQGYVNQTKSFVDKIEEDKQDIAADVLLVEQYKNSTATYASNAKNNELNTQTYKNNAKNSEDNAKISENNSKISENNANVFKEESRSWAVGDNENHTRTNGIGDENQSAQYYSLQAKVFLDEANAIYNEAKKQVVDTIFNINFETGELEYNSEVYNFSINDNGELEWEVDG